MFDQISAVTTPESKNGAKRMKKTTGSKSKPKKGGLHVVIVAMPHKMNGTTKKLNKGAMKKSA